MYACLPSDHAADGELSCLLLMYTTWRADPIVPTSPLCDVSCGGVDVLLHRERTNIRSLTDLLFSFSRFISTIQSVVAYVTHVVLCTIHGNSLFEEIQLLLFYLPTRGDVFYGSKWEYRVVDDSTEWLIMYAFPQSHEFSLRICSAHSLEIGSPFYVPKMHQLFSWTRWPDDVFCDWNAKFTESQVLLTLWNWIM